MRFSAQILVFCIAGFFAGSCYEDPECIDLRNDYVGFTFKKLFDGQVDSVLGITTSGTDSIFYEFFNVGGSILIPLNVATTSQSFVFNLINGTYSMTLDYKSQPQFESVDCGPRFVLTNLNVSQHNFDSISVTNNVAITAEGGSNIDIYRCPITNNLKLAFRQLLTDNEANGTVLIENLHNVRLDYQALLYYSNTEASSVVVPLNLANTTTRVLVDSKDSGLSSLDITYEFETASIFDGCGTQNFLKNIEVSGTTNYDFVSVQKDSITDPPTTNVTLFKCPQTNLIELQLVGAPAAGVQINKVTAGFTSEVFYEDSLTTKLVLPLDETQEQTNYTIEFEDATKQISFGYDRTVQIFHEQCVQTLFSAVEVLSSDFTTPPLTKNNSIQFPTVVNFEITND
ncbi:MAG: DUF6452 family protein [Cyclobacteriaceae bacterium]